MVYVTIIIPIHNSEKYLRECLNSALFQSFKDIEILCIDGGSTDTSDKIIKEFQEKDNRINLIYDTNTSYGHKINLGVSKAEGEYIAILESDDRLEPGMIEKLYHVAKKYDTDIADADYFEFINLKNRELHSIGQKYSHQEDYGHLIHYKNVCERDIPTTGIWTALYKKDFLIKNNIYLNESPGASYQDISFLFLTSLFAEKVYHLNLPLYAYRVDNADSSVKDDKKVFEISWECEFLRNSLKSREINTRESWKMYYIRKYKAFYWNYCRLSANTREKFLEIYIQELKNDLEDEDVSREAFSTIYEMTFLLLENKKLFIKEAKNGYGQPFLSSIYSQIKNIGEQELVLFGAGNYGMRIYDILEQNTNNVKAICDNSVSRQGMIWNHLAITSVEQALHDFPHAIYFITSYRNQKEMKEQLLKEGISEENIMIVFHDR